MSSVDILGVGIHTVSPAEVLVRLRRQLDDGERVHVVTVNNELVVRAQQQRSYLETVNAADLRLPDSAGILWAAAYLRKPLRGPWRPVRARIRAWRMLLQLLLLPRTLRSPLSSTIPGSELTVDLGGMAMEFGYRVYLLGAAEGVAEQAGQELQRRWPGLHIAGAQSGGNGEPADDQRLVDDITRSNAQVLLVAYGQPKQDLWVSRNLERLPAPLIAVGVGGTFDYLAGATSLEGGKPAKQPPLVVRRRGLEWLWRLATQPRRWRRIYNAVPVFVRLVVRAKLRQSK